MPKPLVDILDGIVLEIWLGKDYKDKYSEGAIQALKEGKIFKGYVSAIIKAVKERVPEKKQVNHAAHLNPSTMQTLDEIRAFNSAIDQLNRNLWGRDEL